MYSNFKNPFRTGRQSELRELLDDAAAIKRDVTLAEADDSLAFPKILAALTSTAEVLPPGRDLPLVFAEHYFLAAVYRDALGAWSERGFLEAHATHESAKALLRLGRVQSLPPAS